MPKLGTSEVTAISSGFSGDAARAAWCCTASLFASRWRTRDERRPKDGATPRAAVGFAKADMLSLPSSRSAAAGALE